MSRAVPHPRYRGPVIDIHTHFDRASLGHAEDALRMGGITAAVSLWDTAWPPQPYEEDVAQWRSLEPYLYRCYVPDVSRVAQESFAEDIREEVLRAKAAGAVGIKVWKNLGLWLTDRCGHRIPVNDPRLAPLWQAAASEALPVLIHSGDPPEFWQPLTPQNPRYLDMKPHSQWWYATTGAPPLAQILGEFEGLVALNSATTFIGAHFGCFVADLERWFRQYPNFYVDTAAAVAEIGKGDVAAVRDLFRVWPERILFGTDLARTNGYDLPVAHRDRWSLNSFFERHWLFFETGDIELEHPIPEQLPWRVSGLDLPDETLQQLYWQNACRLYGLAISPDGVVLRASASLRT